MWPNAERQRILLADELFEVFDHFIKLVLKG